MRRIINYALIIALMIPVPLMAQENDEVPLELNLDEAIAYAKKNQVKMKNALLDQKSSLAQNREVTALALPNLKTTGGINYAPLVAGFLVPDFTKFGIQQYVNQDALNQQALQSTPDFLNFALQPKWTSTVTAELSQVLFDPSVMVALQARKKIEILAQKQVELTEQELTIAITKAYYDVLIAEAQKELLDKNVERITELRKETRAVYEVGLTEKIDIDRITVTLNNLKTQQTKVKQLVDLAYMSLKFQIGMPLEQPIALTDELIDNELNAELLTRPFDKDNRIEYQMLKTQGTLLSYDLKRYKLGWLPTLSVFGNYGYTLYNNDKLFDSNPTEKWQDNALFGVQLSIPIFTGFKRRAQVLQAKYAYQKTKNDIENLESALELEKVNAQINLKANLSSLENQRENMKLAEEVYNIAKTKYKEGVGSSLEIMDAETSLKEAQTNYFNALYEAITARINLLKALGEI